MCKSYAESTIITKTTPENGKEEGGEEGPNTIQIQRMEKEKEII